MELDMISLRKKWKISLPIMLLLIVAFIVPITSKLISYARASNVAYGTEGANLRDIKYSGTAPGYCYQKPLVFVGLSKTDGLAIPMVNGFDQIVDYYTGWLPSVKDTSTVVGIVSNQLAKEGGGGVSDAINAEKLKLGWYTPGDTEFTLGAENSGWNKTLINGADYAATSDPSGGAGIYRPELKKWLDAGGMKEIGNNWKALAENPSNISKSKRLWVYFVSQMPQVQPGGLIAKYENIDGLDSNNIASWTPEQSQTAFLSYLDLMMTCYSMASESPVAKETWRMAIDEYITNGISPGNTNCRSNIVVFPGVVYSTGTKVSEKEFIATGCMDMYNIAYNMQKQNNLSDSEMYKTIPGSKEPNMYTRLFNATLANKATQAENTDYPIKVHMCSSSVNTSFRYKLWLPKWEVRDNCVGVSIMEYLTLKDGATPGDYAGLNMIFALPIEGLNGGGGGAGTAPIKNKLNTDFKVIWSGKQSKHIIATGTNINDVAQLKISLKVPDEDKVAWKAVLDKYEKFELSFGIKSENGTGRKTVTTKTSDGVVSPLNPPEFYNNGVKFSPGSDRITVSKELLRRYLWGEITFDGLYDAAPNSQVINKGELQTYGYDIQAEIIYSNATSSGSMKGDWVGYTLAGDDEMQLNKYSVTAYKDEEPSKKVTYYSDPEAFAEIKEGTVEKDGNGSVETWDAMAGVPSTETLYFASGGSEFIVEMELEYIEGEKAERKYSTKFFGTECEFKRNDQFKPIEPQGSSSQGGFSVNETKIQETYVADANGYDTPNAVATDVEFYKGFRPEGASGGNQSINGHNTTPLRGPGYNENKNMSSSTVNASWSGTILNKNTDGNGPAPGTPYVTGFENAVLKPPCQGGTEGKPGTFSETNTAWDTTAYWQAVDQANQFARAYESTNSSYTIKKIADSDGQERLWRIGNATIRISISGGRSNQGGGSYSGGSYTTGNITSAKVPGNLGSFGYNHSFTMGTPASGGVHGDIPEEKDETGKVTTPAKPHGLDEAFSGFVPSSTSVVGTLNYDISVTFDNGTIQAHELCGPCCQHELPDIVDSWKQSCQYDYARVNVMRVYKIYRSYVDGMEDITFVDYKGSERGDKQMHWMSGAKGGVAKTLSASQISQKHNGTDTIVAAISQGDPNIFYNICNETSDYAATSGAFDPKNPKLATMPSNAGRIRYSYQAQRLDNVYHEEMTQRGNTTYLEMYVADQGSRSNKCDGIGSRTICGENPIQSEAHGHADPTGGTDTVGGGSKKLTRWSNGILYTCGNEPEKTDEWWMNDTRTGTEGTVEKAGHGVKKTSYNSVCMDDVDRETEEHFRFVARRNQPNTIFVVSDMLLLQTSSGDQPVMYYAQKGSTRTLQQNFDYKSEDIDPKMGYASTDILKNKFENMWLNNKMAACNWGMNNIAQPEDVNVGSYIGEPIPRNGNIEKFSDGAGASVMPQIGTVFDTNGDSHKDGDLDVSKHHFISGWDGISHTSTGAVVPYRDFGAANKKETATKNGGFVGRLDARDPNYEPGGSTVTPGPILTISQGNVIDESNGDLYKTQAGGNLAGGTDSVNDNRAIGSRMARVNRLRIYTDKIEQNPINTNKEYITGDSYQTYMIIKDYDYYKVKSLPSVFSHKFGVDKVSKTDLDSPETIKGLELEATYTRNQNKVNDIVVHDPVSVSGAKLVEANPDFRVDNRVGLEDLSSITLNNKLDKINVCPKDPDLCEFKVLDCKYDQDVTELSLNFSKNNTINGKLVDTLLDGGRTVVDNTEGKLKYTVPSGFEVTDKKMEYKYQAKQPDGSYKEEIGYYSLFGESAGNYLKCFGTRMSFPLADLGVPSYSPDTKLAVEFDFFMPEYKNPTMLISFNTYDFYVYDAAGTATWNTGSGEEKRLNNTSFIGNKKRLRLEFDFKDATKSKLFINGVLVAGNQYSIVRKSNPITADVIGSTLNIGSWSTDNGYPACFYIDNFKVVKLAGGHSHTDNCYKEVQEHQKAIEYDCGIDQRFVYDDTVKGKPSIYTATADGRYKLEAWGAQGGGTSDQGANSHGGLGGYSTGYITLKKGQKLIAYPGGAGSESSGTGTEYFWVLPKGCGNYANDSVYGGTVETKSGLWRYSNRDGSLEESNTSLRGVWSSTAPFSGCEAHDFAIAYDGDKNAGGKLVTKKGGGSGGGGIGSGPSIPGLIYKTFDGATWARVVYQDISDVNDASQFFNASNMLNVNTSHVFSCLGRLEEFKMDGKFEFMINYPDAAGADGTKYNRWTQTANPLDVRTGSNTDGANVPGYTPIHVDWANPTGTGNYGNGLEFNGGSCILDGSVSHGNWWLAIGAFHNTSYPIPGATGVMGIHKCEMWVRTNASAGTSYDNTTSAGWNGGGVGGPNGFGGGGASDIRLVTSGGLFENKPTADGSNVGRMAETNPTDPTWGALTFGPYMAATTGIYQADIYGTGLDKCKFDAYTNLGSKTYPIIDSRVTPTHATLYFEVTDNLPEGGTGLEVRVHHSGVPGYKFDSSYITKLDDRILIAGGGGGADGPAGVAGGDGDGSGGYGGGEKGGAASIDGVKSVRPEKKAEANVDSSGCGLGGSQTSGFMKGLGESVSWITDTGGAGGGYYGGYVTNDNDGGAGGGSGHAGAGVSSPMLLENTRKGDGQVRLRFVEHETESGVSNSFRYVGNNVQPYTIPESGEYKIELWGASGGDGRYGNQTNIAANTGGAGGYTRGYRYFNAGEVVNIYVGEAGKANSGITQGSSGKGGWNGGGTGGCDIDPDFPESGAGGGGMTHISFSGNDNINNGTFSTDSVIMVAGGGGGSGTVYDGVTTCLGGAGGGSEGLSHNAFSIAGTEFVGNRLQGRGKDGFSDHNVTISYGCGTGGGGGGWFGGTWDKASTVDAGLTDLVGGAGGSGYLGTTRNGYTIDGSSQIPSKDGTTTTTGNRGDGYAKITKVNHAHDTTCPFHSSEFNYHKHEASCIDLSNPVLRAALNQEYAGTGALLEQLLGSTLYNKLKQGKESVIYTLADFKKTDYRGIDSYSSCTLSADNMGNLLQENSTGNSSFMFPVSFPSKAVSKIEVKCNFEGNIPPYSEVYFITDRDGDWGHSKKVRSTIQNGVITFDMTTCAAWKDNITRISFDLMGDESPCNKIVVDTISFVGTGSMATPATPVTMFKAFENFSDMSRWGIIDGYSPNPTRYENGYIVNTGNHNGIEFELPFKMTDGSKLKYVKFYLINISPQTTTQVYVNNNVGGATNNFPVSVKANSYDEQEVVVPINFNGGAINSLSWDTIPGSVPDGSVSKIRRIELWGYGDVTKQPTQSGVAGERSYGYTGGVQSFTAPDDGMYHLQAWGASGPGNVNQGTGSHSGLGGYAEGDKYLTKGQNIFVYCGGTGGASSGIGTGGGWNGGGHGGAGGYGGGGMTHMSTVSTDTFSATINTSTVDNGHWQADPAGAQMLRYDDDSGSGLSAKITYWLPANTTYIFAVGRYSPRNVVNCDWGIYRTGGRQLYGGSVTVNDGCWQDKTFDPDCTIVFNTAEAGNYDFYANDRGGDPCIFLTTYAQKWIPNIQTVYSVSNHINFNTGATAIVAGGGGGTDDQDYGPPRGGNDGSGGYGGGATGGPCMIDGTFTGGYGTQTSGYAQGMGGSVFVPTDSGGAGGGWWGGYVTNHYNGGGSGGSGYIGGVVNGANFANNHAGNGQARISYNTYTSTPMEVTSITPTIFTARYNSPLVPTGDEAGLKSAADKIAANVDEIPETLNGSTNPIFDCGFRYNRHNCDLSDLVNVNGTMIHKCYVVTKVLDCSEPHHYGMHYETTSVALQNGKNHSCYKACLDDTKHQGKNPVFDPVYNKPLRDATYVNTDEYFDIIFPNEGDFYESDIHGIESTIPAKGIGYESGNANMGMETTRWTREKYVKFSYDTLFYRAEDGLWEQHEANEWIELPIVGLSYPRYHFYCTLNNSERAAATVEFSAEAINAPESQGKYNPRNGSYLADEASYGTIQGYDFGDYGRNSDIGIQRVGLDRFVETSTYNKNWTYRNERSIYAGSYDSDNDRIRTNNTGDTASNHINNSDNMKSVSNADRNGNLRSLHGAYKKVYSDLIGRTGNLMMTSTDDVRFCNLFKVKKPGGGWLIDGIVHEVISSQQETYLSWHHLNNGLARDVRNRQVSRDNFMYNTWLSQEWCGPTGAGNDSLALTARKNPPAALKDDMLKVGYNVNYEITSTGNYNGYLQVKPYFYAMCLDDSNPKFNKGQIIPVDVYMNTEQGYQPINYFGLADNKAEQALIGDNVYDYSLNLDWVEENPIRNYDSTESSVTQVVRDTFRDYKAEVDGTITETSMRIPSGQYYSLGNLQAMQIGTGARTFIGTGRTAYERFNSNNSDTNFDNKFNPTEYAFRAQRWHLKLGLPSSAEFVIYDGVNRNLPNTTINVNGKDIKASEEISKGAFAILMTANFKSMGEVWNIYYNQPEMGADNKRLQSQNESLDINGSTYRVGYLGNAAEDESEFRTVLAVYDGSEASNVDVDTIRTH